MSRARTGGPPPVTAFSGRGGGSSYGGTAGRGSRGGTRGNPSAGAGGAGGGSGGPPVPPPPPPPMHTGPPAPPPPPPHDPGSRTAAPRPRLRGYDWREHRVDPSQLDVLIPADRWTIDSWEFYRPETGSTTNHPCVFKIFMNQRDAFMRNFAYPKRLGTSSGDMKTFFYGFPSLPSNATDKDIFTFLSSASQFASGFGLFIPPLHTLHATDLYGTWGPHLETIYLYDINYYDSLLAQVLKSKAVNIVGTPRIIHLLQEVSGIKIINFLATVAGHPALDLGRSILSVPRQKNDMSLSKYTEMWLLFLHSNYLRGTFLSDRYFIETFALNLNNYYATTLRGHIINTVRRLPINEPVTRYFQPENFLTYLLHLLPQAGLKADLSSTPLELSGGGSSGSRRPSLSSRGSRRGSSVRQLETGDDWLLRQMDTWSDLSDEDFAFVYQLSQNKQQCDLCQSDSHLLHGCPELVKVKNDKNRLRRLFTVLRTAQSENGRGPPRSQMNSAGGRSSTPTRNNSSRGGPIRQVLDNSDTDDDSTIAALDACSLGGDTDDESKD